MHLPMFIFSGVIIFHISMMILHLPSRSVSVMNKVLTVSKNQFEAMHVS